MKFTMRLSSALLAADLASGLDEHSLPMSMAVRGTSLEAHTEALRAESLEAVAESAEDSMGLIARAWIRGEGPLPGEAVSSGSAKLSIQEALDRVEDKLPVDIAALAHKATSHKHKGNKGNDTSAADRYAQQFDEASLAKARGILNTMIQNSWVDMDAKIISCKEFEERNRETAKQVRTDLARLGEDVADLERLRTEANQNVQAKSSEIQTMSELLSKESNNYQVDKTRNEMEMQLRQNDLAVVRFIMEYTQCPEEESFFQSSAAPQFLASKTKVAQDGAQICTLKDGSQDLRFKSMKLQAKYEKDMSPKARQLFRQELMSYFHPTSATSVPAQPSMAQLGERNATIINDEDWDPDYDDVEPEFDTDAEDDDEDAFEQGLSASGPSLLVAKLRLRKLRNQSHVPKVQAKPHSVQEEPDGAHQWKKCVDAEPNCGMLYDSMSLMWGKFKDKTDSLKVTMGHADEEFKAMKEQTNEQIKMLGNAKGVFNEMLSEATSNMNEASSESEQKLVQARALNKNYMQVMRKCESDIKDILFNDICAVRKVRNALMVHSAVSPPEMIRDCDVGDFVPGPCSVSCDDNCPNKADANACGGNQELKREVVQPPNGFGIKCPSQSMMRKCNQIKCAVDCSLSTYSAWGTCTKECGGGVQGRTRSVIDKAMNGGRNCDSVQEERPCNTGSCDRDCTLTPWTSWDHCTMACNGGLQSRLRHVLVPIRGAGKCPKKQNPVRHEERVCNPQPCMGDEFCVATQDLVIAIDSSGSLHESGANAIRDFAAVLVDRLKGRYFGNNAMKVGVVQFGNGRVESDGSTRPANFVQGLTHDMGLVKEKIQALTWAKGFTNMAQAFTLADTVLQRGGRVDAQSGVLVITDGRPSFVFATQQKVDFLKEKNVKIFMAPISKFAGKNFKLMQSMATQPWETHLVRIPGLENLAADPDVFAQQAVATFCPKAVSPTALGQQEASQGFFMVRLGGRCGPHGKELGSNIHSAALCKQLAVNAGAKMFSFGKGSFRAGHCVREDLEHPDPEPMKRIPGEKYCKPWTAQYPVSGMRDHQECASACHNTGWCSASVWFPGWGDQCYFFKNCETYGNSQYRGVLYLNPTTQKSLRSVREWHGQRISPYCPVSEDGTWTEDHFYDFYALNSMTE